VGDRLADSRTDGPGPGTVLEGSLDFINWVVTWSRRGRTMTFWPVAHDLAAGDSGQPEAAGSYGSPRCRWELFRAVTHAWGQAKARVRFHVAADVQRYTDRWCFFWWWSYCSFFESAPGS